MNLVNLFRQWDVSSGNRRWTRGYWQREHVLPLWELAVLLPLLECSFSTQPDIQLLPSSKSQLYSFCPSGTVDVNVCCVALLMIGMSLHLQQFCWGELQGCKNTCLRSQMSTYRCWPWLSQRLSPLGTVARQAFLTKCLTPVLEGPPQKREGSSAFRVRLILGLFVVGANKATKPINANYNVDNLLTRLTGLRLNSCLSGYRATIE